MSPVEKIAVWVKDKPIWWQQTVRFSLKNGELTQVSLKEIFQVALMEHGLLKINEQYELAKQPIDTTGFEVEVGEVTLKSISQVINVGALAEDQLLKFPRKGLSIIYGDNGTGKSSYSRILKHACLARGPSPHILGNVFEVSLEPSSAIISIDIDGQEKEKNWGLKLSGDSSLKSIRVFDDDVADHFVAGEDELSYKPAGLHLLEDLAFAIDYIKRQVIEETMPDNGFIKLPEFGDTYIGKFIKNLSHKADISMLEEFIVTEDEIKTLNNLTKEIADLKAKSPAQLRKELNGAKRQFLPLQKFITDSVTSLSDKVFDEINEKSLDSHKKSELAEQLRESLLSGLPLSDIGGRDWQLMWNAAEKFLLNNGEDKEFPPQKDENCPLCLQELSEVSADKLVEFNNFVADQTSLQAKEAQKICVANRDKILACDLDDAPYEAAITLLDESQNGFIDSFNNLIKDLEKRKSIFSGEDLPETIDALSVEVVNQIKETIEQIDKSLEDISDDCSLADIIKKKESLLAEISDKKLFTSNLEQIKSNIIRFKRLKKYEQLESQCKSRSVTNLNSEICKAEVVTPLVDSFDDELKKFGFNRFKVSPKTRGSSGAQLLKLEISEGGEPLVAKVASEGEQRCISIACFLAEIRADKRKSAVIFDDPVNSLSHQWSSRVAKRLVEESLNRQVVVFTHDIVFYKLLLEEVERLEGGMLNELCLERSQKRVGIVRTTPPWDALTTGKRIKQLNLMLCKLKKTNEESTENQFRQEAYRFYGYLREAWERLVEEKLLNQVVTRFGRAIQTNRLRKLVDITEDDFKLIETSMNKCSTYFRGHDSAPAVGDAYPTVDEIEEDLKLIDKFNVELQKNRKRS